LWYEKERLRNNSTLILQNCVHFVGPLRYSFNAGNGHCRRHADSTLNINGQPSAYWNTDQPCMTTVDWSHSQTRGDVVQRLPYSL
jgi:hypothetical protein